jgi:hypothetical protein
MEHVFVAARERSYLCFWVELIQANGTLVAMFEKLRVIIFGD